MRDLVFSLVMDILEKGRFSHIVLREAFQKQDALSRRDKAFVSRLCLGTVERTVQIDYILNLASSVRVRKMKPLLRTVLRVASFQILFLDRVPERAAVHTSVEYIKRHGLAGLAPFTNAVLRRVSREKEAFLKMLRDPSGAPPHVRSSLPEWLYELLKEEYGEGEALRMGEAFLSDDHGSYVRFQDGHAELWEGDVAGTEAFRSGEIAIQDYASQQVGLWAKPSKDDYVVDVCAAPGGKCCHVAGMLSGNGVMDARDLTEEKLSMIRENISRLGLSNIRTKVWDARVPDPGLFDENGRGKADLLLCDLPCSGLGVLKKKPDIRFSMEPAKILNLQKLQREILEASCPYLKKGGRMIYSTCTLTREENEENASFIEKRFGFRRLREEKLLPGRPSDGFYIVEFLSE